MARALSLHAEAIVTSAEIPVLAIHQAFARPNAEYLPIRILNLAPVPAEAAEILAGATGLAWLVVNESEAAAILGRPVEGLAAAVQAAADLIAAGTPYAVVTAGAHGAAVAAPAGGAAVPARRRPPRGRAWLPRHGGRHASAPATPSSARSRSPSPPASRQPRRSAPPPRPVPQPPPVPGHRAAMPRPADILALTGLNWPVG